MLKLFVAATVWGRNSLSRNYAAEASMTWNPRLAAWEPSKLVSLLRHLAKHRLITSYKRPVQSGANFETLGARWAAADSKQ